MLGLIDTPDQEQTSGLEMAGMRSVQSIAVRVESRPGCVERLGRPVQVARNERDLAFGDDTPRAGDWLSRTERARGLPQERLCPYEIAELRHRDASKRERWGIVA
jgi:hypothetical protein